MRGGIGEGVGKGGYRFMSVYIKYILTILEVGINIFAIQASVVLFFIYFNNANETTTTTSPGNNNYNNNSSFSISNVF